MSFFNTFHRLRPFEERRWPWHDDCWFPPRNDFEHRLRRLLGRLVRVGTDCGIQAGRLRAVSRDNIVLRSHGRRIVIRIEAIAWIRPKRLKRRRCRCRRRFC